MPWMPNIVGSCLGRLAPAWVLLPRTHSVATHPLRGLVTVSLSKTEAGRSKSGKLEVFSKVGKATIPVFLTVLTTEPTRSIFAAQRPSSPYHGVRELQSGRATVQGRWEARVFDTKDGQKTKVQLGVFGTAEAAAMAVDKHTREHCRDVPKSELLKKYLNLPIPSDYFGPADSTASGPPYLGVKVLPVKDGANTPVYHCMKLAWDSSSGRFVYRISKKNAFSSPEEAAKWHDVYSLRAWATTAKNRLLPFPPTNFDPASYNYVEPLLQDALKERQKVFEAPVVTSSQ